MIEEVIRKLSLYAEQLGISIHIFYNSNFIRCELLIICGDLYLRTFINYEDHISLSNKELYISLKDYIDYVYEYWFRRKELLSN